jgi:hypothetical protein
MWKTIGVVSLRTVPYHLTSQHEEELFKIGAVCFKPLVTLLRQGVEGRLDDVAFIEVRSVVARVSTLHAWHAWSSWFPTESPKCVAIWIGQEPKAPIQNRENQTLRFDKLDYPVLSIPTASGALSPLDERASPPTKWHLVGEGAWTTTIQGIEAVTKRSNRQKRKEN